MANALNPKDSITAVMMKAKGRPWVLDRLGKLAAIGDDLGASTETIVDAMNDYLKTPEDWNFGLQQKKLVCKAWKLPDNALETPFTVGDLIDFAGGLQHTGDDELKVLRDPKTWDLIKKQGRGAKQGTEKILAGIWATKMGIPESSAFKLTLKQLLNGVSGLQLRGIEGAAVRPEFWDDYGKSPDKNRVFDKWDAIIKAEERVAEAQRDKEINQKIEEWLKAIKKRDNGWEAYRKLKKHERQKQIAKQRRRKKRRRRRRRRTKVITSPNELQIRTLRQVSTPWGNNYLLLAYQDNTAELIRIEPSGRQVVVAGRDIAYMVSETKSGMLHIVPVFGHRTGRRRASPMDLTPESRRGPLGTQ